LPPDPPDPPIPPVAGRVPAGRYALVVGDPAGIAIERAAGEGTLPSLAEAVTEAPRETKRPAGRAAAFGGAVDDVSQAMSQVERTLRRATELMQTRTDPAALSDEIGVLLDLLARLDHDEHWAEALRVARSLAMLLALLGRWLDLLESLQTALGAAERLGDAGGQAWAVHEQGTLRLAAGEHAGASRLLGRAQELRGQIGDRRALAVTNGNLQVLCHALRAELDNKPSLLERILRKPIAAAALATALLLLGGAAGALIHGAGGSPVTVIDAAATVRVAITKTGPGPARTNTVTTVRPTTDTEPTPPSTSKLSVSRTGPGTIASGDGEIDCGEICSHTYRTGTVVKLTATPTEEGGTFVEWGGACTGVGTCDPTLSRAKSVTATFAPAPATLTVTTTGDGRGAVKSSDGLINCGEECSHAYLHGTAVKLTAEQVRGFAFEGWSGPGASECGADVSCTVTIDEDTSVSAEFVNPG
jgi:hypothetical protein